MSAAAAAVTYTLTRFLYIKDEVEISLMTALLKKQNLQECYYWTFELYYSEFDVFQLLWKIYFDFYYELNPCMEDYMLKKHVLWEEGKKIIHIASIVRNLFRLKSSPNAFILRQYIVKEIFPTHIYSTPPKWLDAYQIPEQFHNLLLSINNGHTANSCYYIKLLLDSSDDINTINTIRQLIITFVKPKLIELGVDEEIGSFERKWSIRKYKNDLHYLLAFMCQLQTPISMLSKCNIFVTPKEEDVDFIIKVENEPIPLIQKRGITIDQIYNTLNIKRCFKISEKIGAFKLSRWNDNENNNENNNENDYNDFLKKNWFHWEYFAANGCPLWSKRVERYEGCLDHTNKKIIFLNEIMEDKFYDLYAYEFDERPKNIQMMSHCEIKKLMWREWYFDIFLEQTSVLLNDDFKFSEY